MTCPVLVRFSYTAGCDERDVSTSGKLHFIDTQSLDIVQTMSFEQETGSIVRAIWHPKINQILLGCGGRRAGMTSILFDPRYSERGRSKPRREHVCVRV